MHLLNNPPAIKQHFYFGEWQNIKTSVRLIFTYLSLPRFPLSGVRCCDYAPVCRVLFDACEFDADQLGASHYDAMLVWRATVWRVAVRRVLSVYRFVHFSRFLDKLTHSALHKEINNVEM